MQIWDYVVQKAYPFAYNFRVYKRKSGDVCSWMSKARNKTLTNGIIHDREYNWSPTCGFLQRSKHWRAISNDNIRR